jgi:putative phosphoesterase
MRSILNGSIRVGLISDTHGLLRPEAIQFLSGSQLIIHCGDICGPELLTELGRIAPVTAVRGNNDKGPWAAKLAEYEIVAIGRIHAYVIHDLSQMDIEAAGAGVGVVLSGHSHKPYVERRNGVLYVNPGSAGPRRFKLPISAAELIVEGDSVTARLFDLEHRRNL